MDIDDAVRRIVRRHVVLIALCALLPALAVGMLRARAAPSYESTARVAASDTAPSTSQEAAAVVSQVTAVATSRSTVAAALAAAKVRRDPRAVTEAVTVTGLGTSPVAAITVADADRVVAQRLAQSLAQAVVHTLTSPRLAQLRTTRAALDAALGRLGRQRAIAVYRLSTPPTARQAAVLDGIDTQLGQVADQRAQVVHDIEDLVAPSVVDPATEAMPASRGAVSDTLLALALGLLGGLAAAAAAEVLRPSVVGLDALAAAVDAVPLGRLLRGTGARAQLDEVRLANRVVAAAARLGVEHVVVAGPLPTAALGRAAERVRRHLPVAVEAALPATTVAVTDLVPLAVGGGLLAIPSRRNGATVPRAELPRPRTLHIAALDEGSLPLLAGALQARAVEDQTAVHGLDGDGPPHVGVLVAAPSPVRRAALRPTQSLLAATGWPVVGAATYHDRARHPKPRRRSS